MGANEMAYETLLYEVHDDRVGTVTINASRWLSSRILLKYRLQYSEASSRMFA